MWPDLTDEVSQHGAVGDPGKTWHSLCHPRVLQGHGEGHHEGSLAPRSPQDPGQEGGGVGASPADTVCPLVGHEGTNEVSQASAEDGDEKSVAPSDLVREDSEDKAADKKTEHHEGVDDGDPVVSVTHLVVAHVLKTNQC